MITPYEIIARKRDGNKLSGTEIEYFIGSYTRGDIPDYQMSALLMAIYLQGMDTEEGDALVQSYLNSGSIIDLKDIPGRKVDKHSTGGVGDKVSIILAPMVAAAGVTVPMISGRGLGHSGGTLDKLQSIPGFRVDYTIDDFLRILKKLNVCLIGQTAQLAPADKKIYALRDVTATVQSIPLIGASIMSKKLAEGIDALVLDVKCGVGAFMQEYEQALELAKTLIRIGENAGKETVAYITNMNTPLGNTVGNWLEIEECIECLQGHGPEDLMQVTYLLAGTMIYLGHKAKTIEDGIHIAKEKIRDGSAWKKFVDIVKEQEGDYTYLYNPDSYPKSKYRIDYRSARSGWIESINAFEVGMTGILIGAGRLKQEDHLDSKAGVRFYCKPGSKINSGDLLFSIFTDKQDVIEEAKTKLANAIIISKKVTETPDLVIEYLDKSHL